MHSFSALSRKLRTQISSYQFAQAGFTMIELLIVIAILGILAVAVLSAINPIEQINRGRDTGRQSDAEQYITAIDRFTAFQGYLPWQTAPGSDRNTSAGGLIAIDDTAADFFDSTGTCTVQAKLSSGDPAVVGCTGSDELKDTFFDRINNDGTPMFIFRGADNGDSTYVCFEPQSSAFRTIATSRCASGLPADIDGTQAADEICTPASNINGYVTETELYCIP